VTWLAPVRRLLDELSWEGNARKYRNGGIGLENVLTTEVFQALDFLPRQAFLGRVLAGASGAPVTQALADIEQLRVDLLPGDLAHPDVAIRAQPDVLLDSQESFVFVEAKRPHRSSFQPEQLAKELILTMEHGRGRHPVLLLILGAPPPIRVQGHGALAIDDALQLGQRLISARHGHQVEAPDASEALAWTTWAQIGADVAAASTSYGNSDESTDQAVSRIALTVTEALRVHA
jgi:hypothetical protein